MSSIPFTRALGARPGVQLNALKDNTDTPSLSVNDQVVAVIGRFPRGRIDKAFRVSQNDQARNLGASGSLAASALNEPRVQIYEALRDGAYQAVVSRLVPVGSTVLNLMIVKADGLVDTQWSVAASAPGGYLLSIKHLECFSDGIYAEINAQEALDDTDTPVASKWVTLRLKDPVTNELLFDAFSGSLDPLAKDEFGASTYLPNVISAVTDLVEVTVAAGATVATASLFYGVDTDGADKFVGKLLAYFTEGGTTYVNTDYDAACEKVRRSQNGYGYIISGGTQNTALLSRLLNLGFKTNKQVRWDIAGGNAPAAAITFYNSVGGAVDSHYSQCFWAPLLADDPLNGGKAYIGTAGINVGLACARNAQTNANGIAPKNYPIAGSDYSLTRSGVIQKFDPEDTELDDLAKAGINPVLFMNYQSGGRYAFTDSLTGAKTNGARKLIATAEMSSTVDDTLAAYAQECLQKPMDIAIKRMTDFTKKFLGDIETAKWATPSAELGNRSFIAEIKPNSSRPTDRMDVGYWVHYDGTARAIYIQQTLSK